VHLEGAIPHEALWQRVQKYDQKGGVSSIHDLLQRFRYRDFPHFIEAWVWKNSFLRMDEDFEFIAEAVAAHWRAQNIVYVEAFYSPGDFRRHGLEPGQLTCAIRRGLDRVPEVQVQLVADLIRDFGPKQAALTLAEVAEVRHEGVVGVGIGGSEQEFPPEPFALVFEQARHLGFRTSAHAGEAAGSASVWGAIRSLDIDRIGHATRAAEDDRLLDHRVHTGTPLELCPLSNVATGVIAELSHHPIRRYFDLGVAVTVNTDDPAMFGNDLAGELDLLADTFAFSEAELRRLVSEAVYSAWLDDEQKDRLYRRIQENPAWPV
jgi:adenosine deaminase